MGHYEERRRKAFKHGSRRGTAADNTAEKEIIAATGYSRQAIYPLWNK
jgi:hypothetical protein